MKKFNLFSILAVLALSAIFVTACSDDDDPISSNPDPAEVLIVHASPNAPGVDIFIDDDPAAAVDNLGFPSNTGYVQLPAGTRNVKISADGDPITSAIINANLMLDPQKNYTVFAVDSVSNLSLLVLEDDLTAPATNKAHVRFVHLSPNAPAVDVAVTGGPVVFADREFKEFTSFTPLDAGTYDLEVRLEGTSTVVLSLPGITLQDGKIYTVFAKGFVGGTGSQALDAGIIVNN